MDSINQLLEALLSAGLPGYPFRPGGPGGVFLLKRGGIVVTGDQARLAISSWP